LNYAAQRMYELDREEEVEILVTDWGSEIPLWKVLELSPAAARIVSFIMIPPDIARDLQKNSPFPEVLALNVAARRSSGQYIGRIDQDTLVGKRFLEFFFDLYEGRQQLEVPLNSVLLFANQRKVPYRVVVRSPSYWDVDKFISRFGRFLEINSTTRKPFYDHNVGIWLLHRNLWNECGGYDERMIYMNAMEYNMAARLLYKYKVVNLGQLVNYDFYHLEHHHWLAHLKGYSDRKTNPKLLFADYSILNPNGKDWGLAQSNFEKLFYSLSGHKTENDSFFQLLFRWLDFAYLVVSAGLQIAIDKIVYKLPLIERLYAIWAWRVQLLKETIHRQPLVKWPHLLVHLWIQKQHDHRKEPHNLPR
jgi:hypothetical protein